MSAPLDGPAAAAPAEPLRSAAVGGLLWQGTSFLGAKVLVLLATAVLARVLTPEDFGLVAFALVVIAIADVVGDAGTAQALVYLPPSRRRTDAALATALVSASALALAAVLAAPLLADFFDAPEVTALLRVLSLSLVLGAAASVPEALLRRDLRFRRTVPAGLAKAGVTGALSIGLALAGAGPWALVWGQLAGLLVYNVALWRAAGFRPDLRWWRLRGEDVGPVLRYGAPVAGLMLLAKVVADVDYAVVGRTLGTEALGLYTLAFRLPELAIVSAFFVLSSVAFPVYSRARGDAARLARGYLAVLRLQAAYGAAAGVGLALLAPYVVLAVFGPQWRESVVALAALSLYAAVRGLGAGANDLYKAVGRPGLAVWLSLGRLVVLVPVLVLASRWGIEGVAWAQLATTAVFVLFQQGWAARLLDLPVTAVLRALLPALVVALGAALGTAPVRLLVDGSWPGLLLGVPAGAAGALVAVRLLQPAFLDELRGLARRPRTGAR